MAIINQKEIIKPVDRAIKAENLVNETKVLAVARLTKMLVDLFGSDEPFKKTGKFEGQEIEIYFQQLDKYLTFFFTSDRKNFDCYAGKANDPLSSVTIAIRADKILQVFSNIVRLKNNLFGLIKLLKYIIPGKIKIKGSYIAALKWARCIMIGKHDIYKIDN